MNWKEHLRILERLKEWDMAIEFMQDVIKKNPDDMDAYIFMNYLLMNLLVEEYHDETKHDYYEALTKKYFDESYAKFSNNPEYLFFTGITAVMSEWYFGIDVKDYEDMLEKAMLLNPNNLLYKRTYYLNLDERIYENQKNMIAYAEIVLQENSPIKEILKKKGALGEYLLELMVNWSKKVLCIK